MPSRRLHPKIMSQHYLDICQLTELNIKTNLPCFQCAVHAHANDAINLRRENEHSLHMLTKKASSDEKIGDGVVTLGGKIITYTYVYHMSNQNFM